MLTRVTFLTSLFLLVVTGQALAEPELAVSRSGQALIFDFVHSADTEITALQFSIDTGSLEEHEIEISNCVAGLPATHVGACRFNPGFVKIIVYSNDNSLLSTTNVGSIEVLAGRADRSVRMRSQSQAMDRDAARSRSPVFEELKVQNVLFTRPDGSDIQGKVL